MNRIYFYLLIAFFSLAISERAISQTWTDVAPSKGIDHYADHMMLMAGGAAWIDYNNDGWEDLYLTGGVGMDRLYKSNSGQSFTDVTVAAGFAVTADAMTTGVVALDYDNDGDKDLFVATGDSIPCFMFRNNGNGTFTEVGVQIGIIQRAHSFTVTSGDYNLDGNLDIFVTNYSGQLFVPCEPDFLYVNNGNGTYSEVAELFGVADVGCGLGASMTDYDLDGDIDLMVSNDFGWQPFSKPNSLYRNDFPTPTFTNVAEQTGFDIKINGMGVTPGDYDMDGDFDYYLTNIDTNFLLQQTPDHKFVDKARAAGVINNVVNPDSLFAAAVSWGAVFQDVDNDLDLDLAVANGWVMPPKTYDPDRLFINQGDGTFTDETFTQGFGYKTSSRALAYADYDADGDIDFVITAIDTTRNGPPGIKTALWQNNLVDKKNWVQVKLQSSYINRDAIGTVLKLHVGGKVLLREVDGGNSYNSHNSLVQHFGLANHTSIDSLEIFWIGAERQVVKNLDLKKRNYILQPYNVTSNINLCKGAMYKGITITKDTTIYEFLKAKNLADSNVTVNLKVLPTFATTHSQSLCKGTKYNNVEITKDTVMVSKLTASNGCDSLVTMDIRVLMPSAATKDTTICKGGKYNDVVYTSNSVITETYQAANGCDSVLTVNITVTPAPFSEEAVALCYGDQFDGKRYYDNADVTKSFSTSQGCDSIHLVRITVYPTFDTKNTKTLKEGESFLGIIPTKDTVFVEHLTSARGCDSIVTTNVIVDKTGIWNTEEYDFKLNISPNPTFGPSELTYFLTNDANIQLSLFDVTGNEVINFASTMQSVGEHRIAWDGRTASGDALSNGTYLLRLQAGKLTQTIKVVINK